MSQDTPIIEVDTIALVWRCEDCRPMQTVLQPLIDIASVGCAVCPHCKKAMTLQDKAVVERIEDVLADIAKDVPEKEWDKLPQDLTDKFDTSKQLAACWKLITLLYKSVKLSCKSVKLECSDNAFERMCCLAKLAEHENSTLSPEDIEFIDLMHKTFYE